jgi:hypothetical protein
VVWVDYGQMDFSEGGPERELKVEKMIFDLNGDVSGLFEPVEPLVFGRNTP